MKKPAKNSTTKTVARSSAAPMQNLHMTVCKWYRKLRPSGAFKELSYSDSAPDPSWNRGMKASDRERRIVRAPTTLRGVLDAIAKAAGSPADDLSYRVHMRGNAVHISATTNHYPTRCGRVAYVGVDNLLSPLPWRKRDTEIAPWSRLPETLDDSLRTYSLEYILAQFTPEELAGPWLWKRPAPKTDRQKAWRATVKLTTDLMKTKHLTLADVEDLRARVKALNAKRKAAA